jgi:hypothetical protein
MADTQQQAPQTSGLQPIPALGGSINEAQEALLSLAEPEEEKPKAEEAKPTEEEESTEETQDESLEEEQPDEDGEEEEGEEPDDLEESDEAEEAEEPEETTLYTVKVNGEDTEVTEDELIRGYSRQSDYTKKTQELAEERRSMDAAKVQYDSELSQLQQERQQYVEALTHVIQSSMAGLEQYGDVDWATLKEEDPIQYITKRDEYREIQERTRENQHRMQLAQQQQNAEMQEVQKRVLQEEHGKLVAALPEWGEPASQKKLATEVRSYAIEQGYSPEEIGGLVDHRSLLVLMKAQKYDALQKADVKSKKVKNKPKVVRAGTGIKKTQEGKSQRRAQMKRLRGTGHLDDASALLEDFIDI